jgi:hypothetical protein
MHRLQICPAQIKNDQQQYGRRGKNWTKFFRGNVDFPV